VYFSMFAMIFLKIFFELAFQIKMILQ